jgi:DNA polymerase-3 subunit beta
MKFTCTKDNLIKGLSSVSGLTSRNISLPILNNVCISATSDGIELSATNLEIGIQKNIRGKIEKQGKITLPAKILLSFINLLPEERVEFELMENNEMLVKSGTWQTKIKTQSADEYPLIPEVEKKNEFKISVGKLKNGLAQTIFAAMNNESRPELSGGLFRLKENSISLVATDSYRLAEKKIEIDTKIKKETQFIVPIKTLQELLRLIGDIDSNLEIQIFWEENQIMFKIEDLILTSRLIDGEYPDYEQIIPENSKTSVRFSKSEIVNAIKASALFSKTGIFDVNFEFKAPDKIILKSSNTQLGENTAEISAEVKGDDNNIVFNYHYILDGLNNIPGQNLILELTNANNPAVLRSEGEDDYLYLVMSIRQ